MLVVLEVSGEHPSAAGAAVGPLPVLREGGMNDEWPLSYDELYPNGDDGTTVDGAR